jgi:hypothetical protein
MVWFTFTAIFVNLIMFLVLAKPDVYYIVTKYRNSRLTEDEKDS